MVKEKIWDPAVGRWVQTSPSQEEFIDHTNDGKAHGIGDKALLKTADKTSLVNAINEAFTSASNGKTTVANAVTAKGVAASPSDTFPVLATKIGQITTGKKWASGTSKSDPGVVSAYDANSGSSYNNFNFLSVSGLGLDFTPSYIVLSLGTAGDNFAVIYDSNAGYYYPNVIFGGSIVYNPSGSIVTSDGFKLLIGRSLSLANRDIKWKAFQ